MPSSPLPSPPGPPDRHGDAPPSTAALQRFGTVRFRHGDKILCLAYAPDGKTLAAGGGNDPVRLWDAESGKLLNVLKDIWTMALAFSPDGKFLATGGGYKVIRVWDRRHRQGTLHAQGPYGQHQGASPFPRTAPNSFPAARTARSAAGT